MHYLRYPIFALCLFATLPLFAQEKSDSSEASIISKEQARKMGREAVTKVTRVYKEKGMKAAFDKADVLNAALWVIPHDRLTPGVRTDYRGCLTPEGVMRQEMWREAQFRSGRSDPIWSLEIFKWLDDHELEHRGRRRSRLSPLANNLHSGYRGLGRMGEAHLLIQQITNELHMHGLNSETEELEDLGPWHPDFPMLRMRPFRIKQYENSNNSLRGFYDYRYFSAMKKIASQSVDEGQWQRAGELCLWVRAYGDAFGKSGPYRKDNQGFDTRQSYSTSSMRLAYILELHGELNLAVEILDELIARKHRDYGYATHLQALVYRELLLIELGRSSPDAIERVAGFLLRYQKKKDRLPGATGVQSVQSVRYAKILHHYGRTDEAWKMIYNLESRLSKHSVDALNTLRLAKIHMALRDGLHEEVEAWLIESLEYVRSKGLKTKEPELYELYAELEAARGNMAAAINLIGEAHRVNKSLNLEYATNKNKLALAKYQEDLPKPSAIASSGSADAVPVSCDLQPEAMTSVSLTGKPAIGRFALSNPSNTDATGTLEIVGEVASVVYDATSNTIALAVSDTKLSSHQEAVTLKAQDQLIIEAHAESPPVEPKEVTLKWINSEHPPVTASWTYSSSDVEVSTSFINASSVKDNPFYLVPIFHTLQRASTSDSAVNNLRFTASTPMRVEVYAESGELIYVDANGDGDLMDSGDQLITDRDHDGHADIAFDANSETVGIEVYFRSAQAVNDSSAELSLELKVGDSWETQCINQISF